MKILVTGGAGFIGSAVVRHIIREGVDEVVNLDKLTYAANPETLAEVEGNPRYEFVKGDICDTSLVRSLLETHRPGAILHLAAETHVDRSIDGPAAFVATNIHGTFQLLEEARTYRDSLDVSLSDGFRFVQVSTDEVYGSIDDGLFREDDPYRPNSPYVAAKAGADHLARAYFRTYGLATVITNGSNTYGPYQFPEKLLALMILNAVDGKPLPVYGKGDNVRDWLYVDDHAAGIMAALKGGVPGESYNIGGGNEFTNINVVRRLCALLDEILPHPRAQSYAGQIDFVEDRPGHDFRYALDTAKAEADLGWRPETDFDAGLGATVRWYLDHQDWCRKSTDGRYDRGRLGLVVQQGAKR